MIIIMEKKGGDDLERIVQDEYDMVDDHMPEDIRMAIEAIREMGDTRDSFAWLEREYSLLRADESAV